MQHMPPGHNFTPLYVPRVTNCNRVSRRNQSLHGELVAVYVHEIFPNNLFDAILHTLHDLSLSTLISFVVKISEDWEEMYHKAVGK